MFFCDIEVALVSFWYQDLVFSIDILHSVVRHLDLLAGINPGLDIRSIGGPKKISIPKRRSTNLDTKTKHLDTN